MLMMRFVVVPELRCHLAWYVNILVLTRLVAQTCIDVQVKITTDITGYAPAGKFGERTSRIDLFVTRMGRLYHGQHSNGSRHESAP